MSRFDRVKRYLLVACQPMLVTLTVLALISSSAMAQTTVYPDAPRGSVIDVYHEIEVADPYQWLEDSSSQQTREWEQAQTSLTDRILNTPLRANIKDWFEQHWGYSRHSTTWVAGDQYVFWKNSGRDDQAVLYRQKDLSSTPDVVLDPNALSDDGSVTATSAYFSPDGTKLAYFVSRKGSDWTSIKIRNVRTGRDYSEEIDNCHFAQVSWRANGSGFYYTRYADRKVVDGKAVDGKPRVYFHKPGTSASSDQVIFESDNPDIDMLYPVATRDASYLCLTTYKSRTDEYGLMFRRLGARSVFEPVIVNSQSMFAFLDNVGSTAYFLTDHKAPRRRIVAIDLEHPEEKLWREIIPQDHDVLQYAVLANDHIVTAHTHHAHHRLKLFNREGLFVRDIELPSLGSISGLQGRVDRPEMFVSVTSFLYPTSDFAYDFDKGTLATIRTREVEFDPEHYETRQVFVTSRNQTPIPMFLIHRKDLTPDGQSPTLLYGYGGFSIPITPFFSIANLFWLEQGGIVAVACLRGGGEYGEPWHQAGMLANKQNTFDDFIAAAEWLLDSNYTKPELLAIQGGSNGGLTVAAAMIQRPDLFGAVLCTSPLTDMLRYPDMGVGVYYVSEYGDAEADPEQFEYLRAYSPLHNIVDGIEYPAILVSTAKQDDRVHPAHSEKFVAALQNATTGDAPILLRLRQNQGHNWRTSTVQTLDEMTEMFTFLMGQFNLPLRLE